MATVIQIQKKQGKTINKTAFNADWDTKLKFLKEPLSEGVTAQGGFKTFSINKRGDRAVERVEWPDGYELLTILKKV